MVKTVSLVFGIVFVLVAILGFLASGGSMEADPAVAPRLLGLFPVNLLHNLVHLIFGIWGLAASRSLDASYTYTRVGGILYLLLAGLGLLSPSGFGLVPLGSHDIWLHVLLGLGLLGASFTYRRGATAGTSTV